VLHDGAPEVLLVLGHDRVGRVVRERAVELHVQRDELEGKALEHRRDGERPHPVGGVGHHGQRVERGRVDHAEQMVHVPIQHDLDRELAAPGARRRVGLREGLDLLQAGLRADGRRLPAAQLDAVVLGRVVACGEHRPGEIEVSRREVDEVGRGQPDVHDVGPPSRGPVDERRGQGGRGEPAVPAEEEPLGAEELDGRRADPARRILVQFVGNDPADVVGLEDRGQVAPHPRKSSGAVRPSPSAYRRPTAWRTASSGSGFPSRSHQRLSHAGHVVNAIGWCSTARSTRSSSRDPHVGQRVSVVTFTLIPMLSAFRDGFPNGIPGWFLA
jgi:hypothetical protein